MRYVVLREVNGHCELIRNDLVGTETYVTEELADERAASLMHSEPNAVIGVYRRVSTYKPKTGYEKVKDD